MSRAYHRGHMSEEDDRGAAEDAAPEEATVAPQESDPETEDEFSPFDEVYDDFLAEPLKKIIDSDGLPSQVDPGQKSDIAPLSAKTLVCMGDFSKFVIRNVFGDVLAEFSTDEAEQSPSGIWRARRSVVLERMRLELSRARAAGKTYMLSLPEDDWELLFQILGPIYQARGMLGAMTPEWIQVEPLRAPCRHYVRQFTQFEYNAEHDVAIRLCAARRTTEGAFMSVRDRRFAACDMREPKDVESEKILDEFDKKKIEQGARREYLSMFEGYAPGKPDDGAVPITYQRGTP